MHALQPDARELRQRAVVFGGVGRYQPQRQGGGAKVARVNNRNLPTKFCQRARGAGAGDSSANDTGDLGGWGIRRLAAEHSPAPRLHHRQRSVFPFGV